MPPSQACATPSAASISARVMVAWVKLGEVISMPAAMSCASAGAGPPDAKPDAPARTTSVISACRLLIILPPLPEWATWRTNSHSGLARATLRQAAGVTAVTPL